MKRIALDTFTDLELCDLLRESSHRTLKYIYDKHWQSLYQHSYKFLKDEELAKDVVQEVFFDFWKRREELKIDNIRAYLFQSVRFQSLKNLRRLDNLDIHEVHFENFLSSNNTQEQLDFDELNLVIKNSLNELPEKYRQMFEMSKFEHLSNKEIAERFSLSTRTVEWYLLKISKHLKTSLAYCSHLLIALFA
ncbi:sigma-70 family RNA polymerase sigma factor [Fulvivirga sp.]|uniref:sigma-70 family RNA polymerase sigma factor n=1 Tax=Fulvivirga sp. TaxID=1931237 RepID=UPI0032EC636A